MSTSFPLRETLCCPMCHSALSSAEATADVERWRCTGCERHYPIRFGIPDLRFPGAVDPYLTPDEDLRAAERLVRRAEDADFAGVLASYYETNARVPAAQARRFIAGTLAARGRADTVLHAWQSMSDTVPDGQSCVDAGCGTGALSVAAASAGYRTLGVDVGLRWLVLAKVRARDAGVPLATVCAHADRLPLRSGTAEIVASEYLLENLVPATPFIEEARRVLHAAGRFWCTTANRFTPAPDPHLGVPFAGWWPEPVVRAWARHRHILPPVRHLHGPRSLRRTLSAGGFDHVCIEPAPVSRDQRDGAPPPVRIAIDIYERIARSAAGRRLLTTVSPSFVVTAQVTAT